MGVAKKAQMKTSKLLICNMTASSIPSNPMIILPENREELNQFKSEAIAVPYGNKKSKAELIMAHKKEISLRIGPGTYRPDINKIKYSPMSQVKWV